MRCSVDNQDLEVCKVENRNGWLCTACKGAWLPSDFISSFRLTDPWFVDDFYECLTVNLQSASDRQCPEGHGHLDKSNYGKVELDWCDSCEGVWFDGGELEDVVSMAALDSKESAGKPGENWPTTVLKAIAEFLPG
jgi:Zn-finger nucleic acid-binding protein